MSYASDIVVTHPQSVREPKQESLISAIEACMNCAQVCNTCADACLTEETVEKLRSCIRSTNDTSDVCTATGKVLSRLNSPRYNVLRALVRACLEQVRDCGMQCSEHASMHEHCRICADACRGCESALSDYLSYIE